MTPDSLVSQQVLPLDLRDNDDSADKAPPRLGLVTRGVPGRLATCKEVADVDSIHRQPVDTGQPSESHAERGGTRRVRYSSFEELLAASVGVDDNGCWIWLKRISHKGYGQIYGTRDRPSGQAHRFIWENIRGAIPDGLHLDHLCRVRSCVNPDHLEPVTPAENNRRSQRPAARKPTSTCRNGHPADVFRYTVPATGRVRCRQCNRDRWHESNARRKAASQ